jgi:hypothetical protein
MQTQFTASQSVEIFVNEVELSLQDYLSQPIRIIHALTEADRVEVLGQDRFRLRMRALKFMTLTLQPVVEMQVWAENGSIQLRSLNCVLEGLGVLNDRFRLDMQGSLRPDRRGKRQVIVTGLANLQVELDLPPPFSLTPKSILETTGNALLRGILASVQQTLSRKLVSEYLSWARLATEGVTRSIAPPRPL